VKIIAALLLTALFAATPKVKVPSTLEATAKEMLTNLTASRFDAATKDFNDTLRATIKPTTLAEVKQEADAKVGAFQRIEEVRQRREDGFRVVELVCRYEKGPVALKVVFDATDRIGAVFFNPIAADAVDPVLEEKARELVTNFTVGHFEEAMKHFDPVMRHNLPAEGLLALSKQVGERYGTFTSVGAIRQRKAQGLRIVDIAATYSLQRANISVVFNADNQIAGLRITPLTQ
jgi:hypothetical protein